MNNKYIKIARGGDSDTIDLWINALRENTYMESDLNKQIGDFLFEVVYEDAKLLVAINEKPFIKGLPAPCIEKGCLEETCEHQKLDKDYFDKKTKAALDAGYNLIYANKTDYVSSVIERVLNHTSDEISLGRYDASPNDEDDVMIVASGEQRVIDYLLSKGYVEYERYKEYIPIIDENNYFYDILTEELVEMRRYKNEDKDN